MYRNGSRRVRRECEDTYNTAAPSTITDAVQRTGRSGVSFDEVDGAKWRQVARRDAGRGRQGSGGFAILADWCGTKPHSSLPPPACGIRCHFFSGHLLCFNLRNCASRLTFWAQRAEWQVSSASAYSIRLRILGPWFGQSSQTAWRAATSSGVKKAGGIGCVPVVGRGRLGETDCVGTDGFRSRQFGGRSGGTGTAKPIFNGKVAILKTPRRECDRPDSLRRFPLRTYRLESTPPTCMGHSP
jgi:hypothetical protein